MQLTATDGAFINLQASPPTITYRAIPHPIPQQWKDLLSNVLQVPADERAVSLTAVEVQMRALIGVFVTRTYIPPTNQG